MSDEKFCGVLPLCIGYFAAYVPYSLMTKFVTSGPTALSGFEIQPIAAFGTLIGMLVYITCAGWWKFATHFKIAGVSLPRPQWFTFISGLCTSGQIITTTLAYTFEGVSIVFAMLLMRGGVLVMAPMVDIAARKRKRKIYWPSWVASILSLGALFVSFAGMGNGKAASVSMTIVCSIDICIYLFVYFFRLLFMSNRAKSDDVDERKRYFVEEQMVANVVLCACLLMAGLAGSGMAPESFPGQIWHGIVSLPFSGNFLTIFLIGIFSYGTGLFGSLIFLDKRENTFTVPANRASSIIAGVVATYILAVFYGQRYPGAHELAGVALIIGAIIFLAYRTSFEKKTRLKLAAEGGI